MAIGMHTESERKMLLDRFGPGVGQYRKQAVTIGRKT